MSLPLSRYNGVVYRCHHPRWAFNPLSGEGARRRGGRFNRMGLPALYTSLLEMTALREAQQGFVFKTQPMTLVAYDVDCADVIDLCTEDARRVADAPLDALGCAWEDIAGRGQTPPTWALADRLIAAGCAGAIVPSYATGAGAEDRNLVFWRWSDAPPHRLRVIDDHGRLPKNDQSWR